VNCKPDFVDAPDDEFDASRPIGGEPRKPAPHRYEDQYGNERWSDDNSKVQHTNDGR
jgi:hypothetical protein